MIIPADKVELSIIVVSYNTRQLTKVCLETVFDNVKGLSYEVIVVDNASSDGSDEMLYDFSDKIQYLALKENIGFAAANNLAAKEAKGKWLLLLNPDTEIVGDAVQTLLEFGEHNPHAKIWGGRTIFKDGSLNPASCWNKPTIWSLTCQLLGFSSMLKNTEIFNPEGIGGWARDQVRYVDIVTGCFFLVKAEFWRKLNGFHPDFFMYGEEADFCLRAIENGANPVITPDAVIVHYGGASETVNADKMVRLLKSKTLLAKKHFLGLWKDVARVLIIGWPFTRMLAHKLLSLVGRKTSVKKAQDWAEIWQRRKEWVVK